jgi:hypothetical protein
MERLNESVGDCRRNIQADEAKERLDELAQAIHKVLAQLTG